MTTASKGFPPPSPRLRRERMTAAKIGAGVVALSAAAILACSDSTIGPLPPSVPTAIAVSPGDVSFFALGDSARLSAEVRDQHGWVMEGAAVTWASSAPGVAAVDAAGLVTAVGDGSAAVTATSGEASGSAQVTVAQEAASVAVSADTLSFAALGDTVRLSAEVRDHNGQVISGAAVTWASSDPGVAAVDAAGLVTAVGDGSAAVTATSGEASGSAQVTVAQEAASVAVSADTLSFAALGDTVRLSAEVRDHNGQVISGAAVTWASSDPGVAAVDAAGLVTAVGDGSAAVTATSGEASGSAQVTVAQEAASVAVSADTLSFAALGDTVRLSAEVRDHNGQVISGAAVTWASSDPGVAAVDAAGLVTAVGDGSAAVTATSGEASGSAQVTVAQEAASVAVSADTLSFAALGDTVRLSAEVRDHNGQVISGAAVTWASSDPGVAAVDSAGLVTAVGDGSAAVTATSGEASGSAQVTVAQEAISLVVSPASATLEPGDTVRLSAEVRDHNGQVISGAAVTWASSDPGVAAVDSTGLVTAVGDGSAAVTATSGEASGSAQVTVAQEAASVAVSADTLSFAALGDTVRLSAEVRDHNGQVISGAAVTWASSDPGVAAVDSTGLVTAVGDGSAAVTATSGEASGSAQVTVAQEAASVAVSADTLSFAALGDTVRLSAEVRDHNGQVISGAAVTWASSDPGVAAVDSTGLVTAVGDGSAAVTATSGEASGSAQVTVAQEAISLVVSPASATLEPGDTVRLSAEVRDHNGQVISGAAVTWASSDPAVAAVDATGLVTALAEGSTTVTATSAEASGSADITVVWSPDRDPLVALYESANGPGWTRSSNWLTDAPLRDWYGVETNAAGRVTYLGLWENDLEGTLPLELGDLTSLEQLSLHRNQLTGPIPPELGSLGNLERLSLHRNQLTGPIPPELGSLGNLERLWLLGNQLTGSVPSELGRLAKLSHLSLNNNRFSGALPSSLLRLGRLVSIAFVDAGVCAPGTTAFAVWAEGLGEFHGPFCNEQEVGALESLYGAAGGTGWADSNGWLGGIALEEWSGVTADSLGRVTALDMSGNDLAGQLPTQMGQLSMMTELRIGGNPLLRGLLPVALADLSLEVFHYAGTELCAPDDQAFGEWLAAILSLEGTGTECTLTDREALVALYTAANGPGWYNSEHWLTEAPLGMWYGVQTNAAGRVTRLSLGWNDLEGAIPPELGGLSSLSLLYLGGNQLTGPIPPELGGLSKLEGLYLYGNQLTGAIPPELGGLSSLSSLYLYGNQLTGAIPSELGSLSSLWLLYLGGNQLTGPIPPELGGLSRLTYLQLEGNRLTGAIPSELGSLSSLWLLYLYGNQLTGPIPSELGGLSGLRELYLYGNQLAGPIPSELGGLSGLTHLYLSDNRLTGPIPPELGGLSSLTRLWLSNNQLSGALPASLTNLGTLEEFFAGDTGLCAPFTSAFNSWLAGIARHSVARCSAGATPTWP